MDGADRSARQRDGDRAPLSERAQRPGSPACNAILVELARDRDGAMVKTFMALAAQALDFADLVDGAALMENGLQRWLDDAAMMQMDVAEIDQRLLDEGDT